MQMFSIARLKQFPSKMQKSGIFVRNEQEIYLRLEPNGNLFWTLHKELASQWEHAKAEELLKVRLHVYTEAYLVEAVKTDA